MDRRSRSHHHKARSWRAVMAGACCGALLGAAPVAGMAGATARPVAPLVVYSSEGYGPAVARAFEQATGIGVELDTNASGTLLDEVEASTKHPRWGVLWIDGPTSFAHLDQQHLLLRGVTPHVDWNSLGASAVPKDRSYVPTGVTLTEAEVYTTKVVTAPPTTWKQLLEPQWRDAVGMDNPAASAPTFPFIAGMMQQLGGRNGVEAGERYFSKLHQNGLVVRTTNGTVLQELTSGKIKVGLVQSSTAAGAVHTHPTLAVRYLAPVTEVPSAVGIDAKASEAEQAEARKFEEFVLTPQGQKVMQTATPSGGSLYYPVIAGEQPVATLPSLSSVKTQQITPYVWGPREQAIDAWFATHVAR